MLKLENKDGYFTTKKLSKHNYYETIFLESQTI